ncbi:MAG: RraA family protein [Chloroflexi bacterium]|nr:RraA family protein [Chloroflexota bacterium]
MTNTSNTMRTPSATRGADAAGTPDGPADDASLIRRLGAVSTPTAADILDLLGLPNQVLAAAIAPVWPGARLAGPAVTARGRTVAGGAGAAFPLSYDLFRALYPGCVLVMDTQGHAASGPWGENVALGARNAGCAGVVINGGTRDRTALKAIRFPTFARYVTPLRAHGRYAVEAVEVPLDLPAQTGGTVRLRPGDFVLGDGDGVMVIPAGRIEVVVRAGEHCEHVETQIRAALLAGENRETIDRRHDKWAVLREQGFLPSR